MNLRMWEKANSTKGNGIKRLGKEMEWEFNFGLMDQNMRGCGERTKHVEKEE